MARVGGPDVNAPPVDPPATGLTPAPAPAPVNGPAPERAHSSTAVPGASRAPAGSAIAGSTRAESASAADLAAELVVPARARSSIGLLEENCTVCMLCVRECPDWCITIEAHKEERTPPTGGRPRHTNQLDRFAIDFGLCLYCGICVDVCPFDALFWAADIEPAATSRAALVHERDLLRTTLAAVRPPPAHDSHGETPKEVFAAGAQD